MSMAHPGASVLLVEDDAALAAMLHYNLEHAGFRVSVAGDAIAARAAMAREQPDLLLLDWMLPGQSGIELCRQLRGQPGTRDLPVVILTARGEAADQICGLDSGADDYIAKPFSVEALLARIRAVLRRAAPSGQNGNSAFHDVIIDHKTRRVTRGLRRVALGPTEYRLLSFLVQHPARVFSREDLLHAVWGKAIHVELRTVDVHIRRLRRLLNGDGELDLIRTVRAAGYALDIPDPGKQAGADDCS